MLSARGQHARHGPREVGDDTFAIADVGEAPRGESTSESRRHVFRSLRSLRHAAGDNRCDPPLCLAAFVDLH